MPILGVMTFPVYRKEDDNNLFLAHQHNLTGTAFIFWGGPHLGPGTPVGNIKLGHSLDSCPEGADPMVTNKIMWLFFFKKKYLGTPE